MLCAELLAQIFPVIQKQLQWFIIHDNIHYMIKSLCGQLSLCKINILQFKDKSWSFLLEKMGRREHTKKTSCEYNMEQIKKACQ